TGLALNFNACSKQSPLQADLEKVEPQNQFRILPLGFTNNSLQKVTTVSKWITVQNGGFLTLQHTGNGISVNSALYILPGTISQDAEVSLSLDDEQFIGSLDLVFEPHGITFSQPALLTIVASGLDLSGYDPTKLDIYYYDEDTGAWEKMQRDAFIAEPYTGSVIVQNARLPHFSRYAIAAE
ncbi:MAG: hypothetical protein ACE5HI_20470, partial [bacterium]